MFNNCSFKRRPTRVEISFPALENNVSLIKSIIGNRKIMGIVKANAYGHGLVEISRQLEKLGIEYLGVAYIEEAVYLRKKDIKIPILVLGAIDNSQIPIFIKNDVNITGSSIEKLEKISEVASKMGKKAKVHLKIDTGMGRIGVQWDRKEEFLKKAYSLKNIEIVGIFSHFADSPMDIQFTKQQLERFQSVLGYIEKNFHRPEIVHMANTGALSNSFEESFFDMVRPGLLIYGYSQNPKIQKLLEPVMSFKTKISYFKVLGKDSSVGYDRKYYTKEQTRIVTLPVGYADGYPRSLSNKGFVYLREKRYPVIGNVCMDQVMVNIGKEGEAYVGDDVELWGENISLHEISKQSNRCLWELLSGISERVPRIYKNK